MGEASVFTEKNKYTIPAQCPHDHSLAERKFNYVYKKPEKAFPRPYSSIDAATVLIINHLYSVHSNCYINGTLTLTLVL